MIIKFSNLGAIKETELDLRPLTIIIGPNNSNKTYIAYSIYGLCLHNSMYEAVGSKFNFKKESENLYSLEVNANFIKKYIEGYRKHSKKFADDLTTFFQDSTGELFTNTEFDVHVTQEEIRDAIQTLKSVEFTVSGKKNTFTFSIKESETLLISTEIDETVREAIEADERFLKRVIMFAVNNTVFGIPFALPAERNALIMTYKLLVNRRYKLLNDSQRNVLGATKNKLRQFEFLKEQGDVGYPQPVEDFLEFLADIDAERRYSSGNTKIAFQNLAGNIERSIQGGNKTKLKRTKLGGAEIQVEISRGLSVDLHNASSSIKQLAPLLLYLRYNAVKGHLLIIDEPEMNLHPESQVKLLEVLTILVSLGVKILVTTHSPYFMAHLNNLISNVRSGKHMLENQASVLYLKDSRAFLSMNQVSAYEMKDNKLRSLKDEDYGIRWDTLSDVSADLQQKFFEIDEKGKATPRATKKQPTKRSTKKKQQ